MCVIVWGEGVHASLRVCLRACVSKTCQNLSCKAPNVLHMHFHTVEHKSFYFLFLVCDLALLFPLSSHITGVGCNVLSSHGRTGR